MNAFTEKEALSILMGALELPKEEQQTYISTKCEGNQGLRERVEKLLEASKEPDSIPVFRLGRPGGAAAGQVPVEALAPLKTSAAYADGADNVGPYHLIEVIGEGGMGIVYLAEQRKPKRRVALKVIQPRYLSSESSQRRFERESQLLGRLEHPGIARIYDAGTAMVKGRHVPFIAMELVEGELLRKYVKRNCPTLEDKLMLIAKIADGVHSAHLKAVVHRDLKPENILVTKSGQPKILDFGIATSTEIDVDQTHCTQAGQILGTLAYMSPEQIRSDTNAVDARSDIYSLGLIAYEILTGQPAFQTTGSPIDILVRGIERGEPTAIGRVDPSLRGDVQIIIGKACREEPSSRYDSAAAMASDIRSYAEFRPISARPLSRTYEVQRFVRRNRGAVGAAALLGLMLIAGLITSLYLYNKASKNEAQLLVKTEELETLTEFQAQWWNDIDALKLAADYRQGLIKKVREAPNRGLDESEVDARVQDLERLLEGVDHRRLSLEILYANLFGPAILGINKKFEDGTLDQANLLQAIANTLRKLGLLEEAIAPQRRALTIRTQKLEPNSDEVLSSKAAMGLLFFERNKFDDSRQYLEEVLQTKRALHEEGHEEIISALADLATTLFSQSKFLALQEGAETPMRLKEVQVRLKEVQGFLEQILETGRSAQGEDHRSTLRATALLGRVCLHQEEFAEAKRHLKQALEAMPREFGAEDLETIDAMVDLATALLGQREIVDAQELLEKAIEIMQRVFGGEHEKNLKAMGNLAGAYFAQRDFAAAEDLLRQVLEIQRRVLGDDDPSTVVSRQNLETIIKIRSAADKAR